MSVVTSPPSLLILFIWVLSLFFLMSLLKGLSVLFIFSKNQLLDSLIFFIVPSVSHLVLIFIISFFPLTLGFVCCSFPSSFKCEVRLFIWAFSCSIYLFKKNFFCYSITVVCLFSPSLHPNPAEPTSLPHLYLFKVGLYCYEFPCQDCLHCVP